MRIGIDLGGSKIEIICLNPAGETLLRRRVATPAGDYQATLQAITALIRQSEDELGQQGSVGIGIPGAISPHSGLVKNANSTCLIGQPLHQDLQQQLQRPVRISNDANCFTVSEASDGAAAGAHSVFGVILGTGVGGGIVMNGQPVDGPNAIAGEWGHNPLPWPQGDEQGSDCYCGRFGCIETWLSGPGFVRDHHSRGGVARSAQEIMQQVEQGAPLARASIQRYEQRLARALASVINILDPEVIVLGGGMSNIGRLYEQVPKLWGEFVFSDHVATRLVQNQHGDSSGVRGAAWLWPAAH